MQTILTNWIHGKLFTLIPDDLRMQTFIAGSAVLSEKAHDYDLWILGGPDPDRRTTLAGVILNDLEAQRDITFNKTDTWEYDIIGLSKIATVYAQGLDKNVHIMVSREVNVEMLLEDFDITCHAWAVDAVGRVFQSRGATMPDMEQPRVQRFDTPHSTLRRYVTICDRYGVKPHWPDVEILARKIVEIANNRAAEEISDTGVGLSL